MIGDGEDRQYNDSVLKIIYEDANESLRIQRDETNSINTKLTLLIGFNASFAILLSNLPMQSVVSIKYQHFQEVYELYPCAESFFNVVAFVSNSLLSTKSLIPFSLGVSVIFAITGVFPSPVRLIIRPQAMLEKGKSCSEEDFRIAIINTHDTTIKAFEKLSDRKTLSLRCALLALGGAALLTICHVLGSSRDTCKIVPRSLEPIVINSFQRSPLADLSRILAVVECFTNPAHNPQTASNA
jgi:hypothetical protein